MKKVILISLFLVLQFQFVYSSEGGAPARSDHTNDLRSDLFKLCIDHGLYYRFIGENGCSSFKKSETTVLSLNKSTLSGNQAIQELFRAADDMFSGINNMLEKAHQEKLPGGFRIVVSGNEITLQVPSKESEAE